MVKTTTAAMDTHLQGTVTSLATCWRVTRTDGTEFFFTDHDADITFDGNTYEAESGYSRTAIQNDSSLSVDNLNLEGILDSTKITVDDLRAGLYDYAEIRVFVVNWADLTMSDIKMRRGWIGEVTVTEQGIFRAELRGMSQALSQQLGDVYQPECRADLGDSKCKVPIQPDLRADSTAYSVGDFVRVVTDSGATGQAQYENRIYECTVAGTTSPNPPTFDTTVGNTTSDGGVQATAVLTVSGVPGNGSDVFINGRQYEFVTTLTDIDGKVLIGADAEECIDNLVAAINLAAGAGTLYAASTAVNNDVSAVKTTASTMTITAKVAGTGANSFAISETSVSLSWDNLNMSGGSDTGAVTWTTRQAWTRHGVVDTVTDNKTFTLTVGFDESRAVDDWFNGGALTFESGNNNGFSMEVRDWVNSTRTITLFLAAPFTVANGDTVALFPGCDKRITTCATKFAITGSTEFPASRGNVRNFRGEPHIPGQDELTRYPDAKSG